MTAETSATLDRIKEIIHNHTSADGSATTRLFNGLALALDYARLRADEALTEGDGVYCAAAGLVDLLSGVNDAATELENALTDISNEIYRLRHPATAALMNECERLAERPTTSDPLRLVPRPSRNDLTDGDPHPC